jgi:RHS repeat-associated protein
VQPKSRFTSIGTPASTVPAILIAMVFLGAPSAMAETTVLCSADENPCSAIHQITHVHETSVGKAKLKSSLPTIECTVLFLGDVVTATEAPLVIEGNFTYSSCNNFCSVKEENGPSEIEVLKTGSELAAVTGESLIHVGCPFINCNYTGEGREGHGLGPLTSGQANGSVTITEQETAAESGVCPPETFLTITATPLVKTYIISGALPIEPLEEETEGGENPANPNVSQCMAGDPINCATGNLSEEQTDIPALGGRGPAFEVERSYNSQLAASQNEGGPFGFGWTGPYSASLTFESGGSSAYVKLDNGATATFYLKEGTFTSPDWNLASLKASGENWIVTLPTQEQLEFNKSGQLVKETDRHKNAITLTYKEENLETVKSSAGRTLTFKFKEGHVESIKDPLSHEVKYAYESGNLTKVTLPGEEKANWTFKYDASHRLTEMTDGRGNTTKNEYDSSSRITLQTDPQERKRKLEYKGAGGARETTVTEPNGSKTVKKFNEAGEPTEVTKASGTGLAQTTKYEYNAAFQLVKVTDPNGHVTKYGYDSEGNKTSETDGNENEIKWAYNSTHDLISETTPRGETTTITRTKAGDSETVKRAAPESKTQEMKFKYAENGDLEEATDPLGHVTKYTYDKYGDKETETSPEGDKRTWKYDEDGRVIAEVTPRGNEEGAEASKFETKTERDAQGRPIKITNPLGHETKSKYDASGNLEVLTNPSGHATTYVYDKANQRTEVKAANGDVVKIAYDSEGNVESKTDGNNRTTKYEYNSLNQLTKTTDPLKRETTRTFDAAGNLKELKDAEGRIATYTYDAGNRLKEVKYSEEATKPVTYAYDKDSNVTEMKDATGTTKNTYDELGRLVESENGNKEVVKYKYNLGNQTTEIVYPNAKAVSQSFDKAGRLEAVKDWLGNETKFAYNRDSLLSSTTFPSGTTNKDTYEYNAADRLAKTTMARGGETLASISYGRDKLGQLETATQKGLPGPEEVKYGYDERERMTSGAGGSFKYDPANNPTEVAGATQKFDEANELVEAGTIKYGYDKFGERTEAKPAIGPVTKYGYDQVGNLISVTRKEEGEAKEIKDTYTYDGTGLRMSQTINGTTTHMTWDTSGDLPLLLYDGANYYLYGPDGTPFEQIASETPIYLHHDQQGSTRLLTNSTGEAKGKYTYTPYGAVEEHTGSASTPLGYDGQYRSDDTALIYLRARAYDPATAQFMSVDPLVSETGAPYFYAGDSPVNGGDPSGMQDLPNFNIWPCGVGLAGSCTGNTSIGNYGLFGIFNQEGWGFNGNINLNTSLGSVNAVGQANQSGWSVAGILNGNLGIGKVDIAGWANQSDWNVTGTLVGSIGIINFAAYGQASPGGWFVTGGFSGSTDLGTFSATGTASQSGWIMNGGMSGNIGSVYYNLCGVGGSTGWGFSGGLGASTGSGSGLFGVGAGPSGWNVFLSMEFKF